MPIYEYRRDDGTTFESTEMDLQFDPSTGQLVTRIWNAPTILYHPTKTSRGKPQKADDKPKPGEKPDAPVVKEKKDAQPS